MSIYQTVEWRKILKLRHFSYLGIAGIICWLCSESVQAQEKEKLVKINLNPEYTVSKEGTKAEVPITQIPRISDIQHPHTTVKDWLAQQQNQVRLVTGVSLNTSDNNFEVILETSNPKQLQAVAKSEGNNFIVDIPIIIRSESSILLITECASCILSITENA